MCRKLSDLAKAFQNQKCALGTLSICTLYNVYIFKQNKMFSYRRELALQGAYVLAKSGRLELGDNILRTL